MIASFICAAKLYDECIEERNKNHEANLELIERKRKFDEMGPPTPQSKK